MFVYFEKRCFSEIKLQFKRRIEKSIERSER